MKALLLTLALVFAATTAASTIWALRLSERERPAWSALGRLPDFGGVWVVDRSDKAHPWGIGDPPWTPAAAAQIAELSALEKAGRPKNYMVDCLPEGMPSFIIMTLNAFEFLYSPGRVTILGEFDGNRTRRIYTDGRPHPDDPELTFNGHSIGRWEGDTLVVEVTNFPKTMINYRGAGGDLRLVERFRRVDARTVRYEVTVADPATFSRPWTAAISLRQETDLSDVFEYACHEGNYAMRNILSAARKAEK